MYILKNRSATPPTCFFKPHLQFTSQQHSKMVGCKTSSIQRIYFLMKFSTHAQILKHRTRWNFVNEYTSTRIQIVWKQLSLQILYMDILIWVIISSTVSSCRLIIYRNKSNRVCCYYYYLNFLSIMCQ